MAARAREQNCAPSQSRAVPVSDGAGAVSAGQGLALKRRCVDFCSPDETRATPIAA